MCSCFTSSQADPSVTSRSPEARRDPAASRWARRRGAVKTLVIPRGQVSRTQARHRAARAETEGSQGPERSTSGGCRRPPRAHGSHGLREPGDGRSQTAEPQGAVTAAGLKSPARWPGRPGVRPGVRLPGSRLSLPHSHASPDVLPREPVGCRLHVAPWPKTGLPTKPVPRWAGNPWPGPSARQKRGPSSLMGRGGVWLTDLCHQEKDSPADRLMAGRGLQAVVSVVAAVPRLRFPSGPH